MLFPIQAIGENFLMPSIIAPGNGIDYVALFRVLPADLSDIINNLVMWINN
jgi:hypothetical protein